MSQIVTPGLLFDREAHSYRLGGQLVPSVTGIIRRHLPIDTAFYTPEARDRGSAVHAAIEYHLDGDLDEASVDERVRPYFEAYQRFVAEVVTAPILSEVGLAHRALRYAGTLDLLAFIRWGGRELLALVDFKTGARQAWHDLQLAAYAMLLEDNRGELGLTESDRPELHLVCQLTPTGYRIGAASISTREARGLFLSCLNLDHFTRKYEEEIHGNSNDSGLAAA